MKWSLERKVVTGIGIALAILVINALVSYRATRRLIDHQRLVSHTHEVLTQLEATFSNVKDAETGERGYIITGTERYLEPYQAALEQIGGDVETLKQLTADNPTQQARIPVLEQKIAARINVLKKGIDLKRKGDVAGVRQMILSGEGSRLMDDLRRFVGVMEDDENELLKQRSAEAQASGRYALLTDLIPDLISCSLMLLVFYIIMRDITVRKRAAEALGQQREWLEVTLSSIADAVIATDTHGSVTFLNPVAQSLTGWPQREAEGKVLQTVFSVVNEQTRAAVENPALVALKEGTIVGLTNTVLIKKDGTEIPIDDSGAPIKDAQGKVLGAVVIFRDITERRHAEQDRANLPDSERTARELVSGDPNRLQQIVWNLLSNAVKFTAKQGRSRSGSNVSTRTIR